jgi:hypothetical protein
MAHFAELDNDNIVLRVMVISNADIMVDGEENEQKGIEFCKSLWPDSSTWVQTSYNNNFRKNYASPGFTYDRQRNAFVPSKPYPSWVLNESTCRWEAPVPSKFNGTDGKYYAWDEDLCDWVELPQVVILG